MLRRSWIVCSLFDSVAAFKCDEDNIHLCQDVPVNIKIHDGIYVHDADWILSADNDGKRDGKGLNLVSVDSSNTEKYILEPVGGKYHIKVLGGTSDGKVFLATNGNGLDVFLWNRDDGSGNQRWDLLWTPDWNYNGFWRFHQNINNLELQSGHEQHHRRRRRVQEKNLLVTNNDGRILLGDTAPDKDGFENWDITPAGCYVVDPTKIIGKWQDIGVTVLCEDCGVTVDEGYIVHGEEIVDFAFQAKLKAVMKGGFRFAGFGLTSKIKLKVSAELTAHVDASITRWRNASYTFNIHPEQKDLYFEKKVWQFVIEATDTCGNTLPTLTKQLAFTDADREPCCVAGYGMHLDYALCTGGEDSFMPGANLTSYCQMQSQAELAV